MELPANLVTEINTKLKQQKIPAHILLDQFAVIDEASRKTAAYADPTYVPFYHYLGLYLKPTSLLEIGVRIGFLSGCFLRTCKTVTHYLGFQEQTQDYYHIRMARKNIRKNFKGNFDYHIGGLQDDDFTNKLRNHKWDMAIVNEETGLDRHLECLDLLWESLAPEGLIVMDYIGRHQASKEAFYGFCKIKNRTPVSFNTRFGVGLIQK